MNEHVISSSEEGGTFQQNIDIVHCAVNSAILADFDYNYDPFYANQDDQFDINCKK